MHITHCKLPYNYTIKKVRRFFHSWLMFTLCFTKDKSKCKPHILGTKFCKWKKCKQIINAHTDYKRKRENAVSLIYI